MLAPVRASLASGKPLEWHRVARLPDYVYFNHSVHLSKGVPCVECHGRVDRMPLMSRAKPFQMQWCLDCHRNPAPRVKPPAEITRMDWTGWRDEPGTHKAYRRLLATVHRIETAKLTQCDTCHR